MSVVLLADIQILNLIMKQDDMVNTFTQGDMVSLTSQAVNISPTWLFQSILWDWAKTGASARLWGAWMLVYQHIIS